MKRILISAAATVAGTMALTVAPAQAATLDLSDPPGDVMKEVFREGWSDGRERWPGAEGDIVFARIKHTPTAVVVYLRHRQLSVPRQYGGFQFRLQGNNGHWVDAGVFTRRARPQGFSWAYSETTGRECAKSNRINYGADSAWMRIARTCLRNPKYVRVVALSGKFRVMNDFEVVTEYWDNAARDGGTPYQLFNTRTPWVVTD